MTVNVKAAAGFVAGALAVGTGISLFAGPRMDQIREDRKPRDEWIRTANEHFAGAADGGVTPDEMKQAADYIREHDMPEGIDTHIGTDYIGFSRAYGEDDTSLTSLAIGPTTAIVGGGFGIMVGGVLALTNGGTTGLRTGHGIAVAATGAALLGSYIGTEMLRK